MEAPRASSQRESWLYCSVLFREAESSQTLGTFRSFLLPFPACFAVTLLASVCFQQLLLDGAIIALIDAFVGDQHAERTLSPLLIVSWFEAGADVPAPTLAWPRSASLIIFQIVICLPHSSSSPAQVGGGRSSSAIRWTTVASAVQGGGASPPPQTRYVQVRSTPSDTREYLRSTRLV